MSRVVSSVCTPIQSNALLKSVPFQVILLTDAFNPAILEKLKSRPSQMSLTETTTLANIFDTIANLW